MTRIPYMGRTMTSGSTERTISGIFIWYDKNSRGQMSVIEEDVSDYKREG